MPQLFRRPIAWLAAAALVILAGVGLTMMNAGKAAKAKAATHAEAPSPYAAVAEGKADVEGGIIQVASRTAGVVREVDVLEGDKVRRGEVLARQEDDAPRLGVDTAQSTVDQVQAQIGLTQVQLATAMREQARLTGLSGVVSRQQVDQAADAVASAQATLASERAAVEVAHAQLNEARYRLEQTIVRAPVDGVIVRRYANPGTGASTLNVTPMFDLEPAGARIVRAEVTETDLPSVRVGQAVSILPEADQSKSWPGKVLREAAVFGARKLQSDDPAERTDERVVEVVVSADAAPFLVGQRVLVKFIR
jgi:HlyD family secretion protein